MVTRFEDFIAEIIHDAADTCMETEGHCIPYSRFESVGRLVILCFRPPCQGTTRACLAMLLLTVCTNWRHRKEGNADHPIRSFRCDRVGLCRRLGVFPDPAGSESLLDALGLSPTDLISLRGDARDPIGLDEVRLLSPVPHPPQFMGIELNYKDHAAESGFVLPESPMMFGLLPSAVTNPDDPIEIPVFTHEVDWEVELGVVIGVGGRDIPESEAIDRVAGYGLINHVSVRDIQMGDGQWSRAKSFDTFKPMGPRVTTADELGAAGNLAIKLWVNGELKQSSTTTSLPPRPATVSYSTSVPGRSRLSARADW